MKIFSISDLHLSTVVDKPMDIFGDNWDNYWEKIKFDWQNKVSDDDVVLICGDISWAMKLDEASHDLNEIAKLNGKKILIKGNHDYWWQSLSKIKSILPENMFLIQNDAIKIGDYIFCGSRGWQINEDSMVEVDTHSQKMINRERLRFDLSLKTALSLKEKDEKIIFLTHYPPFNSKFTDGFFDIFEKYNVYAVVYGHLHGKSCRAEKLINKNGIKYYLTSCDLVDNKLVSIE